MSHTLREKNMIPETGISGHQNPPHSAHAQAPQGVSNIVNGSDLIFSTYLEMATEEDKKMAENWKADADGILIFTGFFSATVASLISVSIQDIRQDPQDTSNFYLANIYQTLADPNRPNISNPLLDPLPASPPPFSPPNHAVWVNALWFLSLVISLTCALLATLLQQWARRYLKVTQPRYAPHKRARIRAFLAEGVEKLLLPWTVEALPTLLHISLFLFFAGLVVFLRNVDLTIFELVFSWVGICTALYGCITVMPIFRHDSPYLTPLSLPAWHVATGLSFITFRVLRRIAFLRYFSAETYHHFAHLAERYGKRLVQGMQKTVEEAAFNSSSEIDTRAFLLAFDSSEEDHEDPSLMESESVPQYTEGAFEEYPQGTDYASCLDSLVSPDEDPPLWEPESIPDYIDGALEEYPQGADCDYGSCLDACTLESCQVHDPTEASHLATDVQVTEGAAAGSGGNAPGGASPFYCWACDRGFQRNQELKRHLQVHLQKRKCPFEPCTYEWNRPTKIKAHNIEVHDREFEFQPDLFQRMRKKRRGQAEVEFVDAMEFHPYQSECRCCRGRFPERIDVDWSVLEESQQII